MSTNVVWYEGAPHYATKGAPVVDISNTVSDGFFETMGMRLVAGRTFRPGDGAVVVVNETLARKFFPGKDAVGQAIHLAPWKGEEVPRQTIIGVVADIKQQGLAAPAGTEAFIPVELAPAVVGRVPATMSVVVRSPQAATLAETVEETVRRLDATLPLSKVRTMEALLWEAVAKPRFLTFVMSIFGGLALLLSVIGVYSVVSVSVAQRTRELGIRMALGARPAGVEALVLRQGMLLVAAGIVAGLAAAAALNAALSRVLASVLYRTSAVDPLTFALVGGLLGAVAAVACWLPARRATRIDPMIALRAD
jgi:predicted permease